MVRTRNVWGRALLSACALALLAGCQEAGSLLDNDGLNGDELAPTTEEEVFKTLASAKELFEPADDDTETADDETAAFGESESKYDGADPEQVDVSEDSVASDVATGEGEMPVLHGTLAGEFLTDDEAATSDSSGGGFRGRWFDDAGDEQGYIRGDFRPLASAKLPVFITGGGRFHGKYIDLDGRFRGRLRGIYGHTESGRTLFVGRWFDRSERLVGVLKGHWNDEESGGGAFAGRWAAFNLCGETETLDDVTFASGDFGGLDDGDVDVEQLDAAAEAGTLRDNAASDGDVSLDPDDTPLDKELDLSLDDRGLCLDADQAHGFVRGWHRPYNDANATNTDGGVFRADWRGRAGTTQGYIVGRYEYRNRPAEEQDDETGDDDSDDADGSAGDADDGDDDGVADDDADDGAADDDGDDEGDDASDRGDDKDEATARDLRDVGSVDGDETDGEPGDGEDDNAPNPRDRSGGSDSDSVDAPTRTHGVFYGKVYNRDGEFLGFVRGVFGQGKHGLGVFRGKYYNGERQALGVLRGRWDDHRQQAGGPLFGVWAGTEYTAAGDATDDAGDGSDSAGDGGTDAGDGAGDSSDDGGAGAGNQGADE